MDLEVRVVKVWAFYTLGLIGMIAVILGLSMICFERFFGFPISLIGIFLNYVGYRQHGYYEGINQK